MKKIKTKIPLPDSMWSPVGPEHFESFQDAMRYRLKNHYYFDEEGNPVNDMKDEIEKLQDFCINIACVLVLKGILTQEELYDTY